MEKFIAVKLFPKDSSVLCQNFIECELDFSIVNDGSLVIVPLKEILSKNWTLIDNELICPETGHYDVTYNTSADCPIESYISIDETKSSPGFSSMRKILYIEKGQKISILQVFNGKIDYFNLVIIKLI